jgi:hypothetical protein
MVTIIPLVVSLFLLVSITPVYSAVFNISPGDVTGLIAAINAANTNGQENTINITGTYDLTTVNDPTDGGNGLPSITGSMTIDGGTGATIRRSDASETPLFRVLHVAETGNLTINSITIEGGSLPHVNYAREGTGAGILSFGNLTVTNSAIVRNFAGDETGGIDSRRAGSTLVVRNSIISDNATTDGQGPAGIAACCRVSIWNTTISENFGLGLIIGGLDEHGEFREEIQSELANSFIFHNQDIGGGGGISAVGNVVIMNSTIAENIGGSGTLVGAAIFLHSGELSLVNNTIVNNATITLDPLSTGGILADPINNGRIELVNTILAGNTRRNLPSDCGGAPITSLGNNIIGSTAGCTLSLLASDELGDPGLGPLIDDGSPGNGHYPLLDTSPAIDAGSNEVCLSNPDLATDQIGNPRVGVCDIGAIEFQPPVPVLTVAMDIRPDNRNNNINPKSNALIPVAILGTKSFDVSTIDQGSLRFGPNQALPKGRAHLRYVNHDRFLDLVLHFRTQDSGIECGDTSVSITGQTVDGIPIQGSDSITTVGCKAKTGKKK